MRPEDIEAALEHILPTVEKPGRYTGGELNQVVKDWGQTRVRVLLAFPDIYDLGMSNLGLAVLYDILNRLPNALAERAYSPWIDMERAMRQAGVPLYSLETKHPAKDFDILGISLPYETLYTNTLNLLDLAGIPLRSCERTAAHPLILAGGHAAFNPEPMAEFIDAFAIGEGEEMVVEIVERVARWRASHQDRTALLRSLAGIGGVYVPSLYRPHYADDGTVASIERLTDEAPLPVVKRVVPRLPRPPTRFIVPYLDITHNRVAIEIQRGCTHGCRFCQAGMVTRPVRERRVEEIVEAVDEALRLTGYEEVALLSLSSSDYGGIGELVRAVGERFAGRNVNLSLPSLRIESFSVDLMERLQGKAHRGGFTLAPEAATERMRSLINKPVPTPQVLETARAVYAHGWHTLKLYFMIGHPSESMEDVAAIADLCQAVLAEGRREIGNRAQVHAGVSTFVPKPHTPFQWVPCDRVEQIRAKQALLKRRLRRPGLKLSWTEPEATLLEAWLSRGDRRMAEVILAAWHRGARFDAWHDQLRFASWLEAFSEVGLDPAFYTHRERPLDETLPWDHISAGVRKEFLAEDYQWSLQGRTRVDCRERCFACGILPRYASLRRAHPGNAWKCPEVRTPARPPARAPQSG